MKLIRLMLKNSSKKKKNLKSLSLLFLLISFIFANLFGLNFHFIKWNIFSIFFLSMLLEVGNFLSTRLKKKSKFLFLNLNSRQKKEKNFQFLSQLISSFFDYLKRGFLLGIFLEAFKVGS